MKYRKDFLEIVWIEGEQTIRRRVKKTHFQIIFATFIDCFENNMISKQLVRLIPICNEFVIKEDFNKNKDIPILEYHLEDKSEGDFGGIVEIPRNNKIIWQILREVGEEVEA